MQYALRSLGRKMQTRRELLEKLLKRTSPEVAERVLGRLEEWGYLDDRQYAEAFVRSRRERWGPLRLRAELARRGVKDEIIRAALEDATDEGQGALALLKKHAWRHKGERARMVRFLQGRGYSLGAALDAADEYARLHASEENG